MAVTGAATARLDLLGKVMCRDIMRLAGVLHTVHVVRMGGRSMGLPCMSRTGLDARKLGMGRHRHKMQRNK